MREIQTVRDGERMLRRLLLAAASAVAALSAGACTAPGGPDVVSDGFGRGGGNDRDAGLDSTTVVQPQLTCDPSKSSERLPARSSVVSQMGGGTQSNIMSTMELFDRFRGQCGGCHVDGAVGNFRVNLSTFATKVTKQIVDERIATDDKTKVMPPIESGGMIYSKRAPTDSMVQLVALLNTWIEQGSPLSGFLLPDDGDTGDSGYLLSPKLSGELTNIGNCVPGKDLIAKNVDTMEDRDQLFAQAAELPGTLAETDLTTFDSMALASDGVVSFAPAYPLWADNAFKMRHVRVPHGQTIQFDKATQQFHIPPNTRFYKTFLKKVVDTDGNESYRKIETRLIVARPDRTLADGTAEPTALFGTYVWNREETEAVLLTDPQRNLKPFKDRLISYITDEAKAQMVVEKLSPDEDVQYALDHTPGLVRHYAVPGAERCVQCHMGSQSTSFILGFTPLQIARHPQGESGVIEAAMGDELTQLERLIAYGVVSGMTSPADVVPLEKSQEPRHPRTGEELTAQAYMLGNCAHCHNPRGFPTLKSPALKPLLDFLPSATGGIFEFPLERTSPLRLRGEGQDISMPYITPSLRDYPTPISGDHIDKLFCPDTAIDCENPATAPNIQYRKWVDAPWRSLVYRNVDAVWDYTDDSVIFPHMPRHTPGYDCRAPRIMGDWMVSIPALLKNPIKDEDARPYRPLVNSGNCSNDTPCPFPPDVNDDVQPYREVKPGESGYAEAVAGAKARLAQYHDGVRYGFCPDTSDVLDPKIVEEVQNGQPIVPTMGPIYEPGSDHLLAMPDLNMPLRPHWVASDNTDPPGDWFPRRSDWKPALVDKMVVGGSLTAADRLDLVNVVSVLDQATLAPARAELLREVPYGLWEAKPGCTYPGQKKFGDFDQAADRPMWMDAVLPPPAPATPVYTQSAGAAIFTSICFNCHGVQADSKGLLADAIQLMTGGDARVANLRDGLFGPVSNPGGNIARVFVTDPPLAGVTPNDLAARYLAWMALGGTEKRLPMSVLAQVAKAPVLGAHHGAKLSVVGTPSMLRMGLKACLEVLPGDAPNVIQLKLDKLFTNRTAARIDWGAQSGLIETNGDAEMWLRLCSLNNRPVVRVLGSDGSASRSVNVINSLYWGDQGAYPATAPVMDHRGRVTNGIQADNQFPLCTRSTGQETVAATGQQVPACPPSLFARDPGATSDKYQLKYDRAGDGTFVYTDARKWAARGAVNAAFAVFLYLQGLENGSITAKPLFNQCDKLVPAGN